MKVAVTGAAGQIGYALLFRIASGQMFGPETDVELQLLELDAALPALRGVAMELEDGAFPRLKNIVCTSSVQEVMKVFTTLFWWELFPRKQGMERADLLQINGKIFTDQGRAISEQADGSVKFSSLETLAIPTALLPCTMRPGFPKTDFSL